MQPYFQALVRARPRLATIVSATVVAAAIAACNQDRLVPTGAHKLARSNEVVGQRFSGSSHRRSSEDQQVRLTNEIPGFGGIFMTPSHELVAYVKDTSAGRTLAASARAALGSHLSSDGFGIPPRIRPTTVVIRPAAYDWQTLSSYRDFISDSLMNGITGVDIVAIDVVSNRVSVVVDSKVAGGVSELTQALSNHGIPLAAISISRGAAPRNEVAAAPRNEVAAAPRVKRSRRFTPTFYTLIDSDPDSLMGGVRMSTPVGLCTIGAVVDSAGYTKLLSASHCSRWIWSLTGDSVYTYGSSLIGHETTDLAASVSCLVPCVHHRGSDDALWSMDAAYGVAHARIGAIGRTTSRDSSAIGSTFNVTLNNTNPMLYVYDTLSSSNLVVGEEIDAVGQVTGWQKGQIFKVCADYWIITYTEKVYCATEVYILGASGDSGSPFFFWDGLDGALLAGTANAIDPNYPINSDTTQGEGIFFSPWSSILTENGPIDPRNNTTVGTPSLTAVDSSGFAKVSWSAVSTTHTSATTQYQIYQWTWDASTSTYTQNGVYVTSITSLSYKDGGAPWSISAVAGGTQPDRCTYSAIGIAVKSYNRGAYGTTGIVWFQGPANGPGGFSC